MPKRMVRVRDISVPRETTPLKRASRTARGNESELKGFSKIKCTGDEMISSPLALVVPRSYTRYSTDWFGRSCS